MTLFIYVLNRYIHRRWTSKKESTVTDLLFVSTAISLEVFTVEKRNCQLELSESDV